jgi:DNA-binding MarR family transcriptional regulator
MSIAADLEAPPSQKFVLHVLDRADHPLTPSEIGEEAGLAERTVDRSLARLQEAGAVIREREPADLRRVRYALADG